MKTTLINEEKLLPLKRTYSVLLPIVELRRLVKAIFDDVDSEKLARYDLHKLVNDALISNYRGEVKIKSLLVEHFIKDNAISCFEIKANKSRLDFLRINGTSISYEIKSEIDNLTKLKKQVSDYSTLFDYNYVVIHKNHLKNIKELIPKNYGIIIVGINKFRVIKKASMNRNISASKQIDLLTKKEIKDIFGMPKENKQRILDLYTKTQINSKFKEVLKNRYARKWEFIINHKDDILPIDYQFFFQNNILPEIIYGKIN